MDMAPTPGRRQDNEVGCLMNVGVVGILSLPQPRIKKDVTERKKFLDAFSNVHVCMS